MALLQDEINRILGRTQARADELGVAPFLAMQGGGMPAFGPGAGPGGTDVFAPQQANILSGLMAPLLALGAATGRAEQIRGFGGATPFIIPEGNPIVQELLSSIIGAFPGAVATGLQEAEQPRKRRGFQEQLDELLRRAMKTETARQPLPAALGGVAAGALGLGPLGGALLGVLSDFAARQRRKKRTEGVATEQ